MPNTEIYQLTADDASLATGVCYKISRKLTGI